MTNRVYCNVKSAEEVLGDEKAERLSSDKMDEELEKIIRQTSDFRNAFYVPYPSSPVVSLPSFELKMEWPPVRCYWRTDKHILQVIFRHREDEKTHLFELQQLDFEYFGKEAEFLLLGKPVEPGEGVHISYKEKDSNASALRYMEELWNIFRGKVNLETEKMLASILNTLRIYAYYKLCFHLCDLCGDLYKFSAKRQKKRKISAMCPECQRFSTICNNPFPF